MCEKRLPTRSCLQKFLGLTSSKVHFRFRQGDHSPPSHSLFFISGGKKRGENGENFVKILWKGSNITYLSDKTMGSYFGDLVYYREPQWQSLFTVARPMRYHSAMLNPCCVSGSLFGAIFKESWEICFIDNLTSVSFFQIIRLFFLICKASYEHPNKFWYFMHKKTCSWLCRPASS